jgi:hypothetical protein
MEKQKRTGNPCAKTVKPERAYEVWQSYDGTWTWFVLKKYQSPEKEAQNLYARWYCLVQSPITPKGEYGDVYVSTVKQGTRPIDNPLTQADNQTPEREEPMQFDKDVVARIVAEAINKVLKTLEQSHIVDGVAVLPAGDTCMVDVILLDPTTQGTVAFSFVFPDPEKPAGKETIND